MKTYRIYAERVHYFVASIDAENEESAENIFIQNFNENEFLDEKSKIVILNMELIEEHSA